MCIDLVQQDKGVFASWIVDFAILNWPTLII